MAQPTDIYVALSSAPEGIEDAFVYFKPTPVRDGSRLELYFDVSHSRIDAAALRGAVPHVLNGCDYFYVELDGDDVLECKGDPRHDPKYEEVASEPEPETQLLKLGSYRARGKRKDHVHAFLLASRWDHVLNEDHIAQVVDALERIGPSKFSMVGGVETWVMDVDRTSVEPICFGVSRPTFESAGIEQREGYAVRIELATAFRDKLRAAYPKWFRLPQ